MVREADLRPTLATENVRARARRQVDQIQATLERLIDQGRMKPGDRLATERELADQFGTSRSVVRTALGELGRLGKIVRKVGHGTVVQAAPDTIAPMGPLTLRDTSPAELMEFRLAFEPGLAEAITLNASEADLEGILDCLDKGDAAGDLDQWEQWDRAFHRTLIAASHNRLSMAIYETVTGIRHERPWLRTKAGHTDLQNWRQYQREHRRVAEALIERDAPAASAALRDHLRGVRARMLGVPQAVIEPAPGRTDHDPPRATIEEQR